MRRATARTTFWTRWKRGFSALWRAYLVLMPAYVILRAPALLGDAPFAGMDDAVRAIVGGVLFLLFIATAVIFVPVLVSSFQLDPNSIREDFAKQIEPQLDAVASRLGVRWEDHYVAEVEELLRDGDQTAARRVLHAHSGQSWDAVDKWLANWKASRLKIKLDVLGSELSGSGDTSENSPPQVGGDA